MLPAATDVANTTPTQPQTAETYLGSAREQTFASNSMLANGTQTFAYPSSVPDDEFALTGTWNIGDESLTAVKDAGIELNFLASDVYLDIGGTGTIQATVDGKTTTYSISGAPDIYTLVDSKAQERSLLQITLSPGLSAYSFMFG